MVKDCINALNALEKVQALRKTNLAGQNWIGKEALIFLSISTTQILRIPKTELFYFTVLANFARPICIIDIGNIPGKRLSLSTG